MPNSSEIDWFINRFKDLGVESVLDVGCGIGRHADKFADFKGYLGIDLVENYIKKASQESGLAYAVADATNIQDLIAPDSFDAVLWFDSLEHLNKEDGLKALKHTLKVARKCVGVFTPEGFVEQTDDVWQGGNKDAQRHKSGWGADDLADLDFEVTVDETYRRKLGRINTLSAIWKKNQMISVIIPIRNRADLLKQALPSYAAQTIPKGNFELVFIDQNSGDGLFELLKQYSDQLNIKLLEIDIASGPIKPKMFARMTNPSLPQNLGVKQARGDIIVLTSPEVVFANTNLDIISKSVKSKKVVYGRVINSRTYEFTEYDLNALSEIKGGVFCGAEKLPQDFPHAYFIGAMKKDDFLKIGGIEELFMKGIAAEDEEFGRRLMAAGFDLALDENVLGIHQGHRKILSDQDKKDRSLGCEVNRRTIASLDTGRAKANEGREFGAAKFYEVDLSKPTLELPAPEAEPATDRERKVIQDIADYLEKGKMAMGAAHAEKILEHIPDEGRLLEWGMGGSTIYFSKHLPVGAEMYSIDHQRVWAEQVSGHVGENCTLILKEGKTGGNATADEEDPADLWEYIKAADELGKFDCILIDGVARVHCATQAQKLLKKNGVIFLHDAQRWWYEGFKAQYEKLGEIESCDDYPEPTLWWGKKPEAGSRIGEMVSKQIADRIGDEFSTPAVKELLTTNVGIVLDGWLKENAETLLSPVPVSAPAPAQIAKKPHNVMLHCNQVFWRGGTNLFTRDMAAAYPEFNHVNTYFFDAREDHAMLAEFEHAGIDVSHIPMLTEDLVKSIDPTIMVFHNTPGEHKGRQLVEGEWPYEWLRQWPLICVHHNPSFPAFHANLDIFVSESVLSRYEKVKKRMNWKLIPPCIDLSGYINLPRKADNDRCIIGKLTSNSPPRYPEELLVVLEKVQAQVPECGFSIVGGADHYADVSMLNNITMPRTGSMRPRSFYASFDIFVHMNKQGVTDSWGRVVSEAMASGIPVVSENRGGPAEQVDHGVNGFLCDNGDEFEHYLVMLAKDPAMRYEMGMKAREKAAKEFGIDRLRNETMGIILKAALGVI
jgi:glycosyltransferase involved in cell wall biosynthesis/GT2 family glycosyltransferase